MIFQIILQLVKDRNFLQERKLNGGTVFAKTEITHLSKLASHRRQTLNEMFVQIIRAVFVEFLGF